MNAKVAIFYEITKGFSLFLSTLFPIFCEILRPVRLKLPNTP